MPHSSASHQSSAVMAEVTSTIGIGTPLLLTRSTRSLQLPSARASSVTITVFSRAELSRPSAAAMLGAHCITSPAASMSCATVASLLVETKITVPARLKVCIDFSKAAGFHVMPFGLRLAVSRRKLAVKSRNFEEG
jgi:hypothetical protein